MLEETSLESFIRDSDIVITGEGRLDGQTAMGKAPIAVARLAKKYGKPVFAFSGCVTPDAIQCNDARIDAFFPILRLFAGRSNGTGIRPEESERYGGTGDAGGSAVFVKIGNKECADNRVGESD